MASLDLLQSVMTTEDDLKHQIEVAEEKMKLLETQTEQVEQELENKQHELEQKIKEHQTTRGRLGEKMSSHSKR